MSPYTYSEQNKEVSEAAALFLSGMSKGDWGKILKLFLFVLFYEFVLRYCGLT